VTAEPELEEHAEQLAGAIYGTIVVAGLLAATGADDDPEIWSTALWVVATVVVFWLAHSWALTTAHRVFGLADGRRELRRSLTRHWPLVQSAFPPVIVMLLASALGASDETAILVAACSCIVLLGAWGIVVGRQERRSLAGVVVTAAGSAFLGALMVLLKVVIH
jgi:hypothetical protein